MLRLDTNHALDEGYDPGGGGGWSREVGGVDAGPDDKGYQEVLEEGRRR